MSRVRASSRSRPFCVKSFRSNPSANEGLNKSSALKKGCTQIKVLFFQFLFLPFQSSYGLKPFQELCQ